MGYVRGEVAGTNAKDFINHKYMENCTPDTLHEIYDGTHGFLIPYFIGTLAGHSFDEVRRKIENPHSITGSWDCVTMAYSNFDIQPSGGQTNITHFPNADLYKRAYVSFYNALKSETARIGE